jgi:hypothetical protein
MNALARATAIVNDRSILSSESMLYKEYDRRCSIEKKNSGRESQGARRQNELIGGKPPVVKVNSDSDSDSDSRIVQIRMGSQLRVQLSSVNQRTTKTE